MTPGIFVTGVDTGIGKTAIAGAIAAMFRKAGFKTGVMKPAQSGATVTADGLVSQDAQFLIKMSGCDSPIADVNPYCFEKPLSPYHAALAEGVSIDMDLIASAFIKIAEANDVVIVEGAGGIMAPFTQNQTAGDVAKILGLPVVVVSHPFLGNINHTILTVHAAQNMGLDVLGVIFSQYKDEPYAAPDFELIQKHTGASVLGLVPFAGNIENHEKLIELFSKSVNTDPLLAAASKSAVMEKQKSYEERDKKYVWHPFTQMKGWMENQVTVVESGAGLIVKDIEGNEYLDGFSSYWCNVHGHGEPAINRAISMQAGKIAHSTFLGLSNVPAVDLAEELVNMTPAGLDRVFYSDNGSTAVEVAVKMSYQYWRQVSPAAKRNRFLALGDAYHGDTIGAMAVGGIDLYHATFRELMMEVEFLPAPYCYRCPYGLDKKDCGLRCAAEAVKKIEEGAERFAAMIMEPLVQCPAGIITAPEGYLKAVAEGCRDNGVIFIADEVATGFGRTGKMFACEHENVTPDIMCLSKSISGGALPFAATMTSSKIFEAFLGEYSEKKTFFHGHTYTANQLGCAAALANLKLIKERDIARQANDKGELLGSLLSRFTNLPSVGDIRRRGLIAGIEIVKDKGSREPYPMEDTIGLKISAEAKRRGLLVRPLGAVMPLFPAPAASGAQLKKMADTLYESIAKVTG